MVEGMRMALEFWRGLREHRTADDPSIWQLAIAKLNSHFLSFLSCRGRHDTFFSLSRTLSIYTHRNRFVLSNICYCNTVGGKDKKAE
jgi:hypothetical protein